MTCIEGVNDQSLNSTTLRNNLTTLLVGKLTHFGVRSVILYNHMKSQLNR